MTENLNDRKLFKKLESSNISEVYDTLVKLRSCYVNKHSEMLKFRKYGGLKLVLPLTENPKLANVALSIIANCCLDNSLRSELLNTDCIKRLVRIMKGLTCDSLQNRACRALGNIALSEEGSRAVHKLNAISSIIKFLTNTDDKNCRLTAIRTLRILGSGVKNREKIALDRGIYAISKFFQSDDTEILLCSVKAMAFLTIKCSTDVAKQLQDADGLKTLVKLGSHSDKSICDNAVTTLENLTNQSAIRPELGNAGAIPLFIEIANSVASHREVKSAVWALCLCCREAVNRVRIHESNGFNILLEKLKDQNYKEIHECIVVSLLYFRYDEPSLDTLVDMNLIQIVSQHLQKYADANESGVNHDCLRELNKPKKGKFSSVEVYVPKKSSALEFNESEYKVSDAKHNSMFDLENASCSTAAPEFDSGTLNPLPTSQNSFTFSIYSPSYQGIQNNDVSVSDYNVSGAKYHNFCSPPGTSPMYSSPGHFSVDYSLCSPSSVSSGTFSPASSGPRSPASSGPLSPTSNESLSPGSSIPLSPASNIPFSPASSGPLSPSSSGPLSPSSNGPLSPSSNGPLSPSSNGPFLSSNAPFLPSVNGTISPTTNWLLSVASSNSISASWSPPSLEISHKNSTEITNKMTCGTLNSMKMSDSCDDSAFATDIPLNDPSLFRDNSNEAKVSFPNCGKDKVNPSNMKEDKVDNCIKRKAEEFTSHNNISHYIVILLSHFSKASKTNVKLTERACIIALVDFFMLLPQPDLKVHRIFLRLISNYNCFDKLILLNFFGMMDRKLIISHDLSACDYCSKLHELRNNIFVNGSIVAESNFGIGVLANILLTGGKAAQMNSIFTLSVLVKQKALLQKLLVDCDGLTILLKFLSDTDEKVFKDVSACLSRIYNSLNKQPRKGTPVFLNDFSVIHSATKSICKYETSVHDVTFVLDCGTKINANRTILCENSGFFQALLSGYYIEACESSIRLSDISRKSLLVIFHHLHGCKTMCISPIEYEVLLELLKACDKFLLFELKTIVEIQLIIDIKMNSVAKVYMFSKTYNAPILAKHTLHFTLSASDTEKEEFFQCLHELLFLTDIDVMDDIKHSIKDNFLGCRDIPLYSRSLSVDKI